MTSNLRFQAGGMLLPEVSVYVTRPEDAEFLENASISGTWINVYGCRTMGKSSLYTHHLLELGKGGIAGIAVDIGAEVGNGPKTGTEWVRMLGEALAARLDLDSHIFTQLVDGLPGNAAAGMTLERLLVDGLLKQHPGQILLILDEYDFIGTLDYCDDILLALRHIQAVQARSGGLERLSVCLVGLKPLTHLASPGTASTSPIAIPIQMQDFERTEFTIDGLLRGFPADQRPDRSVLHRVLEFSGGQPLVTMELLRQVRKQNCRTADAADAMAQELVAESGLGKDLQLFGAIESALAAQGTKAFAALRAYESLLEGSPESHTAPDAELLLLFGLVRRKGGHLEVKGELFQRRFDIPWAKRMQSRVASSMQQYRGGAKTSGKKICVINTGGTLGMMQRGDKVVAPRDAAEFKSYFTSLDSIADVEFINLFPPRDSINVFPDQWVTISRYIYNRRKAGVDGFVVAHGTDTMAYTASAVAFALGPQLRFPVVFTGAQTTPDVAYGDAHVNLYRACAVAKMEIPEVVISFGNFVYRAVRAQKRDDRRFDGFESPTYPPLAEITGEINVRRELLRPLPEQKRDIKLRADFAASVLIVPQFPGLEPSFFEHLLPEDDSHRCHGVIVQTLGAGNVTSEEPYSFISFVNQAYRQGIPVIVTSQYPPDPGSHTMYTPAQAPVSAGAIHAGNMTLAAAVTKFRWVLAIVFRRKNWLQMAPGDKRKLVSKLMVEKSVVGEF
jgi:L-asparaginase